MSEMGFSICIRLVGDVVEGEGLSIEIISLFLYGGKSYSVIDLSHESFH